MVEQSSKRIVKIFNKTERACNSSHCPGGTYMLYQRLEIRMSKSWSSSHLRALWAWPLVNLCDGQSSQISLLLTLETPPHLVIRTLIMIMMAPVYSHNCKIWAGLFCCSGGGGFGLVSFGLFLLSWLTQPSKQDETAQSQTHIGLWW